MAVSKTFPAEAIAEAAALGLTLFGENRVQEFGPKALHAAELGTWAAGDRLRFHLIGHLQSNKAARAAELFDGVDSLDSVRLAERLNEAAGKTGKRLPVLIEVKLSPEETKAGLEPESEEAAQLLERLPDLLDLEMRGLMTIAPWGAAEDVTRACFRSLRDVAGPLGRCASESEFRCSVDGDERGLCAGHRGRRDAHPHWHGAVWQAHAAANAGAGADAARRDRGSDARGACAAGREEDGDHGHLWRRSDGTTEDRRACAAARRARECGPDRISREKFSCAEERGRVASGELSRSKVFLLRGVTLARATAVLAQENRILS